MCELEVLELEDVVDQNWDHSINYRLVHFLDHLYALDESKAHLVLKVGDDY